MPKKGFVYVGQTEIHIKIVWYSSICDSNAAFQTLIIYDHEILGLRGE